MANALAGMATSLQPDPPPPSPVPAVVRFVAIDGVGLLRVIRMILDTIRALKMPVRRLGPFDDIRAAEVGFYVGGDAHVLRTLQHAVTRKAAKAKIPVLVSTHTISATPKGGRDASHRL